MQFSKTSFLAALAVLVGAVTAAPSNLESRQNTVEIHLYKGFNGTGDDVPVIVPYNTPIVLGTNIDNLSKSIRVPFGFFVELYDTTANGQCSGLLYTTPLGPNPQDTYDLPADAVNKASCIRIRPGF